MNDSEMLDFCKWLLAWRGNKPKLIGLCSDGATYVDPADKNGLEGHDLILR